MSEIEAEVHVGVLAGTPGVTRHRPAGTTHRRRFRSSGMPVRRPVPVRSGVLMAAIALAVAGCGDDGPVTASDVPSPDALAAHGWVLDVDASTPEIAPTAGSVTLSIDDGEVSGTAPCNGFAATMTFDGGEVAFSEIAQTRRSCGDEIDRAESAFFDALAVVDRAGFDDEDARRLVLSGDDVGLVFDADDADDAIVGAWRIVNVAGDDAIESVPDGIEPVVTFADDGTLAVTGLCNTLASSWALDGDRLDIDPVVSTMMACEPPEVMAAESSIGAALDRIDTVSITPDELTASDADGLIVLVATADDG